MLMLKVANDSKPEKIAGSIALNLQKYPQLTIQAVGARAVNQMIKGIIIARGYVAPNGIELSCVPSFVDVEMNGEQKTAIKFVVKGE